MKDVILFSTLCFLVFLREGIQGENTASTPSIIIYNSICREFFPKSTLNVTGLGRNECQFRCVGLRESGKLAPMGPPINVSDGRICLSKYSQIPSHCIRGSCVFTDDVWRCRRALRGVKLLAVYKFTCGVTCVGEGVKRNVSTSINGSNCGQGWKCISGVCTEPSKI